MELPKNLKTIRKLRNLTQETMAEKLGVSTYSYAKIERGETDVNISRLQQIAKIMEIELSQLFCLDEKKIFQLGTNNNTQGDNWYVNSSAQTECKQELEKAHFINKQQKTEIDYLKQQTSYLKEIIDLLKRK
ncbi:helix-turn-helix domain-containing protein [Candidatus Marithrix sp. Canyon 246]|uniref:helix-turn-helix domain-containing protein n=1 Tax=Candidatus Marithrix sp. Canyon 246 TaxID=1827136 RepID=UPI0009F6C757|nr:helix-turn-helix transcriptional regulator [Candidatus Marithrix sp. Canyon 246]